MRISWRHVSDLAVGEAEFPEFPTLLLRDDQRDAIKRIRPSLPCLSREQAELMLEAAPQMLKVVAKLVLLFSASGAAQIVLISLFVDKPLNGFALRQRPPCK